MARLARTLVAEREDDVRKAFADGAKPKAVNEALKAKYGKAMGPKRLYELYRESKAVAETPLVVSDAPACEETAPAADEPAFTAEASTETV